MNLICLLHGHRWILDIHRGAYGFYSDLALELAGFRWKQLPTEEPGRFETVRCRRCGKTELQYGKMKLRLR